MSLTNKATFTNLEQVFSATRVPQTVALTEELEQAALLQRTIKAQVCIYASLSTSLYMYPLRTIALDSSHKHLTTHSTSRGTDR